MASFKEKNILLLMPNMMEMDNGTSKNALKTKNRNLGLIAIVVSLLILLGIGSYVYLDCCEVDQNSKLGTYNDPEVAFRETQKALSILSVHLKSGIESVQYIQEYDNSKNLIFKEQKSK